MFLYILEWTLQDIGYLSDYFLPLINILGLIQWILYINILPLFLVVYY